MTILCQNFIRELVIRGTSPRTQEAYVRAIYCLAKHYHRSPDQVTDEELKEFLFHLANEKHLSASSLNQYVSAFRFFYEKVLNRSMEEVRRSAPRVHKAIRRPRMLRALEEQLAALGLGWR